MFRENVCKCVSRLSITWRREQHQRNKWWPKRPSRQEESWLVYADTMQWPVSHVSSARQEQKENKYSKSSVTCKQLEGGIIGNVMYGVGGGSSRNNREEEDAHVLWEIIKSRFHKTVWNTNSSWENNNTMSKHRINQDKSNDEFRHRNITDTVLLEKMMMIMKETTSRQD